jgi:ligand-binding sensor domain-containing protein
MLAFGAGVAQASPRLLALDDVYACAFASDGTVVAATGGGLRVGARVVTALEGLPDTRVERLRVDADDAFVETRAGSAHVAIGSGLVWGVVRAAAAPPAIVPPTFERFGHGLVRGRARAGRRSCIATSDGLWVAEGEAAPARVGARAIPSGDVSALAPADGGVWVGTFDRGLYFFDGTQVAPLADPALDPYINALAYDAARHLLWIGTAKGLVRCEATRPLRCRRVGDRYAKHALLLLDGGRVLAGGDESLLFVGAGGEVEGTTTRKQGARFRSAWALARAPDGTLFVGTTSGIFYGDERTFVGAPERLRRASLVRGELPDDWVTALLFDSDELIAGTYNAGIAALIWRGGALAPSRTERGLGYVNPGGLSRLPGGELAVATMDGLRVGRFGDFRAVPTLGRDVTAVICDEQAARWVASRRGVATF